MTLRGITQCNVPGCSGSVGGYNTFAMTTRSRALVGWHHQSLIGRGSRCCYGINFTNNVDI